MPDSNLRAKKAGLYANKKPGPAPVLNLQEEQDLVDWIFHCCKRGLPVTKAQLMESVRVFCENEKRNNPFTNNTPGRSWYEGFLKRHPTISERVTETVTRNRAQVSEESMRAWYREISEEILAEYKEDITKIEPNRIFNCDETGNDRLYTIIWFLFYFLEFFM